jgi:hypothetical protein
VLVLSTDAADGALRLTLEVLPFVCQSIVRDQSIEDSLPVTIGCAVAEATRKYWGERSRI